MVVAVLEVVGDLFEGLAGWGDAPSLELFGCELGGDEGEEGAVAFVWSASGAFLDSLDGAGVELRECRELARWEVGEGGSDEESPGVLGGAAVGGEGVVEAAD